jgi:hypothetical protein
VLARSRAVENIDHTRTKPKHPQTNGICKRFNKTVLSEFYQVAFLKKSYPRSRSCRGASMPCDVADLVGHSPRLL